MSGGTPVAGGGFMRQRHSQGYASSGDDTDDDACSRATFLMPTAPKKRTWTEIVENVLWIASAVFIVYFGDRHFNLIHLLFHDERIRRLPLYLGMTAIAMNFFIFFYTSMLAWGARRFDDKWELAGISALPYATILGLIAFCLLCFALWPIFSFLTIPLLFTLFMAGMVIFPHLMIGMLRSQNDTLRTD